MTIRKHRSNRINDKYKNSPSSFRTVCRSGWLLADRGGGGGICCCLAAELARKAEPFTLYDSSTNWEMSRLDLTDTLVREGLVLSAGVSDGGVVEGEEQVAAALTSPLSTGNLL